MSEIERWEDEAEAFYRATGYLRPGKSYAAMGLPVDEEQRQALWKAWSRGRDFAKAITVTLPQRWKWTFYDAMVTKPDGEYFDVKDVIAMLTAAGIVVKE